MNTMPTLATVQSLVEAVVFFVPLSVFLVILVRGSRRKSGDDGSGADNDHSDR